MCPTRFPSGSPFESLKRTAVQIQAHKMAEGPTQKDMIELRESLKTLEEVYKEKLRKKNKQIKALNEQMKKLREEVERAQITPQKVKQLLQKKAPEDEIQGVIQEFQQRTQQDVGHKILRALGLNAKPKTVEEVVDLVRESSGDTESLNKLEAQLLETRANFEKQKSEAEELKDKLEQCTRELHESKSTVATLQKKYGNITTTMQRLETLLLKNEEMALKDEKLNMLSDLRNAQSIDMSDEKHARLMNEEMLLLFEKNEDMAQLLSNIREIVAQGDPEARSQRLPSPPSSSVAPPPLPKGTMPKEDRKRADSLTSIIKNVRLNTIRNVTLHAETQDVSNENLEALASALSLNSTVMKIQIASVPLDDASIIALAKSLSQNETLVSLTLEQVGIGFKGFTALTEMLMCNKKLSMLSLAGNRIPTKVASGFMISLGNSSLTSINLTSCRIGTDAACTLAKHLSSCYYLNLADNRIGSKGAKAIATALKNNSTMKTLILRDNSIGLTGLKSLCTVLRKHNSCLTSLDLSMNSLGPDSSGHIGNFLKMNSAIDMLSLASTGIGSMGAKEIAAALKTESCKLSILNLWANDIGVMGVAELAEALKVNKTLTTLNLRGNRMGPAGVTKLAHALTTNSSLSNLDLTANDLGSEGAAALAEGLAKNSSVNELYLGGNMLGDAGVAALTEGLANNSSLSTLNLELNLIGDKGAASLAALCNEMASLTTLDLSWNRIGVPGARELAEHLPTSGVAILNLQGNAIGEGIIALVEQLEGCDLAHLNVSFNNLHLVGAKAIASMLQKDGKLVHLSMDKVGLNDEGVQAIAASLKVNNTLSELSLRENSFGDSSVPALAEALKLNTGLTSVFFQENMMTAQGHKLIRDALKRNTKVDVKFGTPHELLT